MLRFTASKANGWVFQTEEAKDWYGKAIGKAKVQIIPNAINPDFIKEPYRNDRKKTIVTAGRLTEQKNHVLLLKAFAKICQKFPDYQLVIYGGGGNLKNKIVETVKQLNIEDRVIMPGYTTNIGDKIKDASLFVLSSDFEGMPNALMEAMALGLPCVSTDCKGGGARFLIDNEKNGLLTPIGDVAALAKAIDRMLSDRKFAEQCGEEAHKICEQLAPEKIYREWESLIIAIAIVRSGKKDFKYEANKLIGLLGGKDNILNYEFNKSRFVVNLKDVSRANKDGIQKMGAQGIVEIDNQLKIILGKDAKQLKKYINELK